MKKVIIITGDLATGKSTLASKISFHMNIPYFYKDVLKEIFCDTFGYKNREENKLLSIASFNVLNLIAQQFVKVSNDFILESNFKQVELDFLKELFKQNGYKVFTFVLTGDNKILYSRYLNRIENENRHHAHSNFTSYEEFEEYIESARNCQFFGKIIPIDANNFNYMEAKSIELMINQINIEC